MLYLFGKKKKNGPGGKPTRVFESGSILFYLAKKYNVFIPEEGTAEYVECMNWLFFQMGAAPYMGQFGHFYKHAAVKIPYGIKRYGMETQRLLDVLS